MVVVGRFVSLDVLRLGGVVFRCPIDGSRGHGPWCRQAGGGLSASASGVRGFAVAWRSLLLSSVPPGLRVCVPGVGRPVRPFPSRRWVGFPPFPVVFIFRWGGGVSLFLPLPSLTMHWSVSGMVNWLAVRVAGLCWPCPGSVRLVAHVHLWVGDPFCWGQGGLPPAGPLRQPVLWGHE